MAAPTSKPADKAAAASDAKPEQQTQQKSAAALEEDDEFEDFPVEGVCAELFQYPLSKGTNTPDISLCYVSSVLPLLSLLCCPSRIV
jgi:hypothetical protein